MKNLLCSLVLLLSFLSFDRSLSAQGLDEDISVIYMKANVLMDAERYDEAVRMYNRVLKEDYQYSNAYLKRAEAKYHLGAYKGTKMDIMEYIDQAGVNKAVIHLMAETEYKMNNLKAAKNYISTALELDPFDGDLYYLSGSIALDDGRKNDACEHFAIGSSLNHTKCSQKFNSECYGYMIKAKSSQGEVPSEQREEAGEVASAVDSLDREIEDVATLPTEKQMPEIELVEPEDLDAVQELRIDDELSLLITNGLGNRNVEDKPDIFILSTEDGHVAIDLCVDSDGRVISTEFNKSRSTIYRSSLTSLAMRKTKEFIFMPSLKAEQCGTILFKITLAK